MGIPMGMGIKCVWGLWWIPWAFGDSVRIFNGCELKQKRVKHAIKTSEIPSGSLNEYRLRSGRYKAGMCDAARCMRAMYLSAFVRYKKCLTFLSASCGNFDFSDSCCSLDSRVVPLRESSDKFMTEDKHLWFAVKRRIFSDNSTALSTRTARNVNPIIQYNSNSGLLKVHHQLPLTQFLLADNFARCSPRCEQQLVIASKS